jgi:hypothetical protein
MAKQVRRWSWLWGVLMVVALPTVVNGLLATITPLVMRWRASQIAGVDPYCMDPVNPTPTLLWLLRPMLSPDPGPFYETLYVVRKDGPSVYNWSYRAANFVPIVGYFEPIYLKSGAQLINKQQIYRNAHSGTELIDRDIPRLALQEEPPPCDNL